MSNTTVFDGSNPSQAYMDALVKVIKEGKEVSPRGKKVLELRPVVFEFTNPEQKLTFVPGRNINPFFQIVESLWICMGRGDVDFLTPYNKSIAQFSDDGVYFNAPYGERLRCHGKSSTRGMFNFSVDQLKDVYNKLKADPDTRQAVATIYNPNFDNNEVDTLDRPCNFALIFKIRDGKLDMTVNNRSNDLHWGTFGANMCQFTTILDMMASWLEVERGTYYHITDSLHIYTEDYGHQLTDKMLLSNCNMTGEQIRNIKCDGFGIVLPNITEGLDLVEPHFQCGYEEFNGVLAESFALCHTIINEGEYERALAIAHLRQDPYFVTAIEGMIIKKSCDAGNYELSSLVLHGMELSSWKIYFARFLSHKLSGELAFQSFLSTLPQVTQDFIMKKDMI